MFADLRQELGVRKRPASESSQKQDSDDNVTTPTNITSKIERLASQNSHVTQVVRPDSLAPEYQSSHVQGASVTPSKGIDLNFSSCYFSKKYLARAIITDIAVHGTVSL